ncbi:MAG TPA: UbiA family prenyltransferase [Chitinophagaceae bacterium]|nr:UbiA family prenyltransferase [Chitinophagaceae bacterium]
MLKRSTIQLLRFHFSYFLMPVFFFGLSFANEINWQRAALAFVLIHFLLYPASNGYNSFMDRDTESIGGVQKPMQPERELFFVTVVMDVAGILLSFFISWQFAAAYCFYILCSRMYSYRGIRLKRFAVLSYITVVLNQGGLIFAMVYHAADKNFSWHAPWQGIVAACFLIGGFYPITQIYQHNADAKDKVKTMSMMLGKRGTFIFCAIMYAIAFGILFTYFLHSGNLTPFYVLQIFFIPVIVYFVWWLLQVWKNESAADFHHTMRMNKLASTCTNLAFITLIIMKNIG